MPRLKMPLTEEDIREVITHHEARNRELLSLVRERGADVKQPRKIDVFFWSPDEQKVHALSRDIVRRGIKDVSHEPPTEGTDLWSIQGHIAVTPELAASSGFAEELSRLAARHGSLFDGWGTEIDED